MEKGMRQSGEERPYAKPQFQKQTWFSHVLTFELINSLLLFTYSTGDSSDPYGLL